MNPAATPAAAAGPTPVGLPDRIGRGLVLAAAWTLASCNVREPETTPVEIGSQLSVAMERGDLDYAERLVGAGRQRWPADHGLLAWGATLHRMRWRLGDAVEELREAHRWASASGSPAVGPLSGELGAQLFLAGRYAESRRWLGAAGDRDGVVVAIRSLLDELPFQRQIPDEFATELSWIGDGLPLLSCRLDGRELLMALDTGASWTTLTRQLGQEIGLPRRDPALVVHDGVGAELTARMAVVGSLSLGSLDLGAVPVLVIDVDPPRLPGREPGRHTGPVGVIGFDLLGQLRFTFDPERGSVVLGPARDELSSPDGGGTVVQCVASRGAALVPVVIESRQLWFLLDSGASHSSLTEAGLLRLPGGAERAREMRVRRLHGIAGPRLLVRSVPDLTLRVGDVRFDGQQLPVVRRRTPRQALRPPDSGFPLHGVLGADLLLRCRLTFDGGRLLLEPVD